MPEPAPPLVTERPNVGSAVKPATTCRGSVIDTVHEPVFTRIDFTVDVDGRTARVDIPGWIDARAEPIRNPVTGEEHHVRINLPHGFEYDMCEVGRGWAETKGPIVLSLSDSHAHFSRLHMTGAGVVPVWLHDSRTLLYRQDGKIFARDLRSREPRLLLAPPENSAFIGLEVGPDDRTLYTVRDSDDGDIWLMTLEDEDAERP